MHKTELVKLVAAKSNLSPNQVKEVLQGMLDVITAALKKGEKVTLTGFGTLAIQERAARTGTDPNTGNLISIPKRKTVQFKAGADLVKAVDPRRKPAKPKKATARKKKSTKK